MINIVHNYAYLLILALTQGKSRAVSFSTLEFMDQAVKASSGKQTAVFFCYWAEFYKNRRETAATREVQRTKKLKMKQPCPSGLEV
ncbi:MAG: hypothetical protein F6J94_05385 [Moorea sp. SIO1F2]|uniref:hypothetical protein n=1 Tax=Moorena sp. SIO1F2 TaxID=2607819 RepID=UPI0013B70890|nr:hypothetical protein [Moorena sp. SIO1F2]NET81405.1 hypothetical protein [Moorena sp. SIO1F2]